jgi:16S rRNA (guanine966-N2)-methyltransferase
MRIVAGRWRGRRIKAPAGTRVRPTADRVREAWMSIVTPWLVDARVLDLFAGSGALGLEALSRGAAQCEFVEIAPRSLAVLRENIDLLGAGDAAIVRRADALRVATSLDANAFDVAFADPPYDLGVATQLADVWLANPFASLLGIEHRTNEKLPGSGRTYTYGDTAVTIFRTE